MCCEGGNSFMIKSLWRSPTGLQPHPGDDELNAAFTRLEQLWGAAQGTSESDELEALAFLVEGYEAEHFPCQHPIQSRPLNSAWATSVGKSGSWKTLQALVGLRLQILTGSHRSRRWPCRFSRIGLWLARGSHLPMPLWEGSLLVRFATPTSEPPRCDGCCDVSCSAGLYDQNIQERRFFCPQRNDRSFPLVDYPR